MKINIIQISLVFAICSVIGCVTPNRDEEWREKRLSIVEAVEKLVTDPMFTEKYAKSLRLAKKEGRKRPTMTVNRIENNVDDRGEGVTRQMYKRLQTALRKTAKFEIIDPEERAKMTDAVLRGPDGGERGGSVQRIGAYDSSDFVMNGELVREETGELSLNLNIQDAHSGTVFWSEVVTPFDAFHR